MLVKSKSALLITDVPSFANMFKAVADEADVILNVEESWNNRYRIKADTVILGSKHLDSINEVYIPKVVLILKSTESPIPFIAKGIKRFICDYQNIKELTLSLYYLEAEVEHISSVDVREIIKDCGTSQYIYGDYDFRFDKNLFFYKGKGLYFCESQKRYLADWLLAGHKDNSKRMTLCTLRKKFGAEFLADVDRYGQWRKNEKNVQTS